MEKETFLTYCKNLEINLTPHQLGQFAIYAEFLLAYNEHTNLTAIRSEKEVYLKHFYDSILLVNAIDFTKYKTLIDIGTGAGFPGVVMAILFPHLKVTLVEANQKKCTFLKELIQKLSLPNVIIIQERGEEYVQNVREQFDIVTARAVTHLYTLSELCLPYLHENGYFLPLKGEVSDELKLSEPLITTLGGEISEVIHYTLPIEEAKRTIIKIKKRKKTPLEYPRSFDKMKKALKKAQK